MPRKKTGSIDGKARAITPAPQANANEHSHIYRSIGRRVQRLRKRAQITLKELSQNAGISVALLSRLEHGTVSPSLQTIALIANALNEPFNSLLQDIGQHNAAALIKRGEGIKVERAGSKANQYYELLGIPLENDIVMEPYLITINKNAMTTAIFQHDGVEFIHMLEGCMVYRHGSHTFKAYAGDSLFFDARQSHGPIDFLEFPTKFLSVIAYSGY